MTTFVITSYSIHYTKLYETPLSVYLAHRGWKVANVPLVNGIDPPEELFALPKDHVVGLVIDPQRLVELRAARLKNLGQDPKLAYADYEEIEDELRFSKKIRITSYNVCYTKLLRSME